MKAIILIVLVLLIGCSAPTKIDFPVVKGKVYPYWYECEFNVLYRLDDTRVLMRDANDRPIVCDTTRLTIHQFNRLRANRMRVD